MLSFSVYFKKLDELGRPNLKNLMKHGESVVSNGVLMKIPQWRAKTIQPNVNKSIELYTFFVGQPTVRDTVVER